MIDFTSATPGYITVADAGDLIKDSKSFTLFCRFKSDSVANYPFPICFGNIYASAYAWFQIYTNTLYAGCLSSYGTWTPTLSGTGYYDICIVHKSDKSTSVYFNNSDLGNVATTLEPDGQTGIDLFIGTDGGQGNPFDGRIGDVALWVGKEMKFEEYQWIRNARSKYHPLLLSAELYYPLEEAGDGAAFDNATVYNRGTLQGQYDGVSSADGCDGRAEIATYWAYFGANAINVSHNSGSGASAISANIYDSISVSESASELIPILLQSLSDSITIAESSSVSITPLLKSIYDSITIAENVSPLIPVLLQSIYDSISVSESVSPLVATLLKSIYDSVSVAESTSPLIPTLVQSLSDNVTAGESVTGLIPILVKSLYDSVSVSENVNPLIPTLLQSIYDNVTVSETISPLVPVLLVSIFDALVASDSAQGDMSSIGELLASLYDSITISENVSPLIPTLLQSVSDEVVVQENVDPLLPLLVKSLYDAVTVSETMNPLIPLLIAELYDVLSISDSISEIIPLLEARLSDEITIEDTVTGELIAGRTKITFDGTQLVIYVKGLEVMRIKEDGNVEVKGNVVENAF